MKRLLALLLVFALLIPCASAEMVMYVQGKTADRVHLRQEKSTSSQSLGLYYNGTPVVLDSQTPDGWSKVRIGTVDGYMRSEYLSDNDASAAQAYVISNSGSTWVNMRSEPSMQASVKEKYDNGTRVEVLGETHDGWSYVRVDGMLGYIKTNLLAEAQDQFGSNYNEAEVLYAWTTIVGQSREGDYIHRFVVDYNQEIYFTSMEANPTIMRQDVNFDGHADYILCTAQGASNMYCCFYVFHDGVYNLVTQNGTIVEVCNYQLYPGKNMVLSSANNGNAGALFEKELYRWNADGTQLMLIRRAVSEEIPGTNYYYSGATPIRASVYDYSSYWYQDNLMWQIETDMSMFDWWYNEIENILWQGL